MDLINNSDKASPNDLNFLQNNIANAYKSFPTAQSEILKRTISVKSQDKGMVVILSKLTDVIRFVELVCYEEPFLLHDPYVPNDFSLTGANKEKSHLELINATQAWGITQGDPNILIGITDTGIREDHEDLEDKIQLLLHNSSNPIHGTFVAGCAAAHTDNNKGIASIGFNSGIVFSSRWGSGNLNTVLQIAQIPEVKVINLSWGGCAFNQTHNQLYEEIRNIHDVLVVAGAGNHSGHCGDNAYIYPAAYESVISVTSVGHLHDIGYIDPDEGAFNWKDVHEHYIGDISSTHHHNDKVNIAAPGYRVYSTGASSNSSYFSSSGTSFAAPIVAGTAALVFAANPDLSANEAAHIILNTADSSIYEIEQNQPYAGLLGTGRVDAYAAVQAAIDFDCLPEVVLGHEVWDNEHYVFCEIQIKSNAVLEIRDTVRFSKNAKIKIEKGGKLVVNGGKLTNIGNHTWQGIYVEGDRNLPQTEQNQGTLILENGAIIENARNAVSLRAVDNSWWGTGGIVQATNATFRNNWRDVQFLSYQNTNALGQEVNNVSFFTNCSFETHDNSLHDLHTSHVSMWAVKGVRFTNSVFKDFRTDIDYLAYRGARDGIHTSSASFLVEGCEFHNLHYGINASSSSTNHFFRVQNSEFSSYRGIYFTAMDNVIIRGNTFNVAPGYTYGGSGCNDTYGIYILNASIFTVESNQLLSSSNGATTCGSVGIIARHTGPVGNTIYSNTIEGFTVAIEAIGKNRGEELPDGLFLKCNDMQNNAYDFFVTDDLFSPAEYAQYPDGIRQQHGHDQHTSTLAGNLFTDNPAIRVTNFVNQAASVSYFHHDPQSNTRVVPLVEGSVILHSSNREFNKPTSCPVRIVGRGYADLSAQMNEASGLYEETDLLLQSYTDDGNTQLMSQQVEMAGAGDAYTTYQYLMQTSPYLSEEVLELLAAKEEGFNKAMIRDVLVQNPQAAKSQEINLALDDRLDQLPAYMRWQIHNGLYTLGEKEVMEHFKAYQMNQYTEAFNEVIQGVVYQKDGFENAPDLDQLLAQADDIRYQYLRAEWQFARANYAAGMQLLNQIEEQLPNTPEAMQAHMEQVAFYTLLDQWHNHEDHPGFTQLPQEVLVQLEDFLEATPRVAGKALSLLMLNDAIDYQEPIYYPNDEMTPKSGAPASADRVVPETEDYAQEFHFSLYPNPAKEYITLNWCIDSPRLAETGVIEIRNASGILVHSHKTHIPCDQQILSLAPWSSGTYTATISLENNMRKTITFIVAK